MKGLFWVLVLFAMAAGLSLFGHFDDAYVLLVVPPYPGFKAPFDIALVATCAFFFILYLLLRFIALAGAFPQRFREFFLRRKSGKSQDLLSESFRLSLEGHFKKSLKKASSAYDTGHSPAFSALLAAHAARRLRDVDTLNEWLSKARGADDKTQIAALMLEMETQLDLRQYDKASQTLKELRNLVSPLPEAALWLDLRIQQELKNPDEILRVARLLEKQAASETPGISEGLASVKTAAHQDNLHQWSHDAQQLYACWKAIPKSEIVPLLTATYCAARLALGATEGVRKLIETQLEREWNSDLVALYGDIPDRDDLSARLVQAEKWQSQHGDDFQLLRTLARIAREIDPNKARIYLNALLAQRDEYGTRLDMAQFEEAEGHPEAALEHYRRAAALSSQKNFMGSSSA